MWVNIAGAKRYSRPRGLNIAGASAPVAPAVLLLFCHDLFWNSAIRPSVCLSHGAAA